MRLRIAHVTTCRSDYGPSYWLIHDLFADDRFEPLLVVGGAHFDDRARATVDEIERDGWPIAARFPFTARDDSALAHSEALSEAMRGFARALSELHPDLVILYGDRAELLPIATAALVARVPIAHLCGGDITRGALDDNVRHAITKLSHVHFPATAAAGQRVRQMGEESDRVHVVGDPALDHFHRGQAASLDELSTKLGFAPDAKTLVVTLHPTTLDPSATARESRSLFEALLRRREHVVVTAPAPDPGAQTIRDSFAQLAAARPNTHFFESLGSRAYRALLSHAGAMVGNSSSGLIEAASVPLPVVNIGDRQAGRERGDNVIDVDGDAEKIAAAIDTALEPSFRARLDPRANPYGTGNAARAIIEVLATMQPARLLMKRFATPSRRDEP